MSFSVLLNFIIFYVLKGSFGIFFAYTILLTSISMMFAYSSYFCFPVASVLVISNTPVFKNFSHCNGSVTRQWTKPLDSSVRNTSKSLGLLRRFHGVRAGRSMQKDSSNLPMRPLEERRIIDRVNGAERRTSLNIRKRNPMILFTSRHCVFQKIIPHRIQDGESALVFGDAHSINKKSTSICDLILSIITSTY